MELAFAVAQNGIHTAVFNQSVIANNIANLSTVAFKASRSEAGTFRIPGTQAMDAVRTHTQGPLRQTDRQLDLAVAGEGFFVLETGAGRAFTRAGNFHKDEDGNLVTAAGFMLESAIVIPEEAVGVSVARDGRVYALYQDGAADELGQLELARFRNPAGLLPIGDNVYVEGPDSGDALTLLPGEEGAGVLYQRMVEHSNVDEATEITNQLINQRHFQASIKTFQVMNDLVGRALDMTR